MPDAPPSSDACTSQQSVSSSSRRAKWCCASAGPRAGTSVAGERDGNVGMCTFEFALAVEIFGLKRPELGVPWYDFSVCAVERGPLRAIGGVTILARQGLRSLGRAGTVVVPGWRDLDRPPPRALVAALRRAHARGARLVSICSGAFVLAAGLLDGKRATTHWRYTTRFAERFPRIQLVPDVLYVDEGQLLTSAGSAAGLDLCMHLVPRLRRRGGQPGGAASGDRAAPPGRTGAVRSRAGAARGGGIPPCARARLELAQPARTHFSAAVGASRGHERAHLLPPLRRAPRHLAGALVDRAARDRGAAPARDDPAAHRGHRRPHGHGNGRQSAPPLPRADSNDAPAIPASVSRGLAT